MLDRLVNEGVLSPVTSAEWATPVVPVVKKDGQVRLCGDFRLTVNAATIMEQYPLPRVDNIFANLNGGEVFSTLDLRNAYNQLPLDEDSKRLVVFNTHKGLYCFNRLPFGVSSAPAIFQRRLEAVLSRIPGVQVYLDDIIVSEKANDCRILEQVLQRLREHGLRLRREKCKFRQEQVTFLGHCIDRHGLRPKSDNITALLDAPQPTSVRELKAFLGLLNYYGKFLSSVSTLLAPLYALLAKGVKWVWGRQQQNAFEAAKQAVKNAKLLVHFDPSKSIRLECDASAVGLGAVLSHRVGGIDYPIAFRLRTLGKAEKNYSQLEKEALALVFGVTRFRDYLYGTHFELVTDYKPLTGLFSPDKGIPPMAAARIQRWALLLGGYRYSLTYRKGSENVNADAFSRLPIPREQLDNVKDDAPEYVLYAEAVNAAPISAKELAVLTIRDAMLQQVQKWILQGWPQYLTESEERFRPFFQKKDELTVNQDLIYWGHRIVVPSAAAGSLLRLLHETHPGMAAMKNLARYIFWYPGLDADIERMVRECERCAQTSTMPPAQVPAPWPETGRKWSRVHIDYAGPVEGHMLLVVVDAETKWLEAISKRSTTSEATVEALRPIFARFGLPHTLVSDNGPQFVSAEFQKFVRMNGINHVMTAPYHPQSNGLAERAVRMIKECLRKSQGGGTFIKRLSQFLCRYRRTPAKAGKSPSELLLGYQLRTRLDCCLPSAGGEPRLEGCSSTMPFCEEEPVWLRSFLSRPKWLPGVVTSTQGARMATVSTSDGEQRRHANQLRLRTPKDSNTTQPGGATTSTTTANETSPMPAGMADPTPAVSSPSSQPEAPPPLRRSNRLRRQPQRLNW
nr:uncharacterized protein K02A2.6-like [Rhipicephalus microplus]